MSRKEIYNLSAYTLVGVVAVGMAFVISLRFLGKSHSQEPPPPPPPPPPVEQAAPAPGTPPAPAPAENQAAPAPPQMNAERADDISELQGFLEPFTYDSNNRRDPFQPYMEYKDDRNFEPTQKFELDDFQLVGIMWDNSDPKAMFIDPEQKVHIVGRDESIGRRNGYIAAIREGEVVVVESQRKQGDIVYKTKVLKISR